MGLRRRRAIAVWLTVGLALAIATLTLIPLSVPEGVPGTDKYHHILAFMALTLPAATFYPKTLLRVVVAAALYGALIEIIQPNVGRAGELADFFADLIGICLGAVTGLLLHMTFRRRTLDRSLRR